jgi:acylphosphatase
MPDQARAHVIISGRVQGVAFRMETKRVADRLGLTGWVRNRPDRTVEAVFEGKRADVENILKWCERGPTLALIHHVAVKWSEPTHEFRNFAITY